MPCCLMNAKLRKIDDSKGGVGGTSDELAARAKPSNLIKDYFGVRCSLMLDYEVTPSSSKGIYISVRSKRTSLCVSS